MWVIRAILIVIIVIAVIAFGFFNFSTNQQVDVNLIFEQYVEVPMVTVVFFSFVVGMLVSLVLFISIYIKLSIQNRLANKRITALESEVSILRNRPIEESVNLIKDKKQDENLKSPFDTGDEA